MENYRELFDGIDNTVDLTNGMAVIPINFDNGATTPPLKSVVKTIMDNIGNYGPISRGTGQKGDICTKKVEESRNIILDFFNLKNNNTHTVVFTKNTTEALNLLANTLINNKKDKVLISRMEHHANDLPWRNVSDVIYIDTDEFGRVKLDDIEEKLIKNKGEIKYVSITAASNVTGYLNPIYDIAKLCHKHGAKIIVDGAQVIAHKVIDMNGTEAEEQIDFLVFSAHKAYAPFGSGAIVGLKEDLVNREPFLKGGGCVEGVFDRYEIWKCPPDLFEAGTQNFFGIIAMAKALEDLKEIGLGNIYRHEMEIKDYIIKEMKKMNRVRMYGDIDNTEDRLGVITFNADGFDYEYLAKKMAYDFGIALRCGKFCAHPYVYRLMGVEDISAYIDVTSQEENIGMIRASLALYNTKEEANKFLNSLEYILVNG